MKRHVSSLALLLLAACSSPPTSVDAGTDGPTCMPPASISYTCDPLPAGSVGCSGGTTTYAGAVPDPQAVYPVGCSLLYPRCNGAYPNQVATCDCVGDATAALWMCGL